MVARWSNERDPDGFNNRKPFSVSPTISLSDYKNAYAWLTHENRKTKSSDGVNFFSRSGTKTLSDATLTSDDIKTYKQSISSLSFSSFDSYCQIVNKIWHTVLDRADFSRSSCTCPSFFKTYFCKHILGVAHLEKVHMIPNEAKGVCIEQKKKRGKPPKAKKALQNQAPVVQAALQINEVRPSTSAALEHSERSKAKPGRKRKQASSPSPKAHSKRGRPSQRPVDSDSDSELESADKPLLNIRPRRHCVKQ